MSASPGTHRKPGNATHERGYDILMTLRFWSHMSGEDTSCLIKLLLNFVRFTMICGKHVQWTEMREWAILYSESVMCEGAGLPREGSRISSVKACVSGFYCSCMQLK